MLWRKALAVGLAGKFTFRKRIHTFLITLRIFRIRIFLFFFVSDCNNSKDIKIKFDCMIKNDDSQDVNNSTEKAYLVYQKNIYKK